MTHRHSGIILFEIPLQKKLNEKEDRTLGTRRK